MSARHKALRYAAAAADLAWLTELVRVYGNAAADPLSAFRVVASPRLAELKAAKRICDDALQQELLDMRDV